MPSGKNSRPIYGSDHVAKIKIETKEKYPLKGDQRRRVLDELIKKAGKWMEVSDLNPWMLSRVIERGKWDSLLVKKGEGVLSSGRESFHHCIEVEGKRIRNRMQIDCETAHISKIQELSS